MIFPIGDENSGLRRLPVVTWLVAGICAWLWYRQLTQGEAFTMAWSATPVEITHNRDLTSPVAVTVGDRSVVIDHTPGPWPVQLTLLSSMFLHGSWMHLLGNLMYLLIFADQIEDRLGRFRFAVFYLVCGLVAALAQVLSQPDSVIPILGASGAIAGTLGAYLVTTPSNPVKLLVFFIKVVRVPAWTVLSFWIVTQVLAVRAMAPGEVGGVAYLAHIGGFVAGAVLVHLMTPEKREARARP